MAKNVNLTVLELTLKAPTDDPSHRNRTPASPVSSSRASKDRERGRAIPCLPLSLYLACPERLDTTAIDALVNLYRISRFLCTTRWTRTRIAKMYAFAPNSLRPQLSRRRREPHHQRAAAEVSAEAQGYKLGRLLTMSVSGGPQQSFQQQIQLNFDARNSYNQMFTPDIVVNATVAATYLLLHK